MAIGSRGYIRRVQWSSLGLWTLRRVTGQSLGVGGDGLVALTISADSSAIVWDLKTGQPARSFKAPFATVRATLDPLGRLALLSGFDGKVTLFDLESASVRATFAGGFRFVQSFAILDVLHVVLGWVRAPLPTSATQVFSRLFLVWGITEQFPLEVQFSH